MKIGTSARIVLLGVLTMSLAACGTRTGSAPEAAPTAELTKITVPYSVLTLSHLPVWGAFEAGIFERHGLDVSLTYLDTAEVAALLSGSAQIAQGGGPEVVSANAGGADVVFIATLAPVYAYVLEVAPSIKTFDDLRGKTIGSTAPGSLTDVATRALLRRFGLDPDKDVTIINLASPQARTPALLNGQIDAALDNPPNSYKEEAQGFYPLFDLAAENVPAIGNGITARRDWLQANPRIAQAYIDSIMEGIAKTKADKAFSVGVLKKYLKLEDADAIKAVDWVNSFLIPDVPVTNVENFAQIIEGLGAQNPNVRNFDMTRFIDNSYVQSAVDRGVGKNIR